MQISAHERYPVFGWRFAVMSGDSPPGRRRPVAVERRKVWYYRQGCLRPTNGMARRQGGCPGASSITKVNCRPSRVTRKICVTAGHIVLHGRRTNDGFPCCFTQKRPFRSRPKADAMSARRSRRPWVWIADIRRLPSMELVAAIRPVRLLIVGLRSTGWIHLAWPREM